MSEARQILESIIEEFSGEKFKRFFREKSQQFVQREANHSHHNDDNFTNGLKIGELDFSDIDSLIVCTFEVTKPLSERAGKKAQYEKAKNILRSTENQRYSAGIFIFYDSGGNFRFSLVYPESIGTRRQWNHFRRFTYFVDKTLTNKTFRQRIGDGDFSSLEKIKEAFSVEKVTKDFYKEIAYWYFWACKVSNPPEGEARQENGKEMFIIRLITRIIFVWFMRQKDSLVPDILFNKQKLALVLKDFSFGSPTYYKAILQNLFFATLSTEIKNRKFRSEFRAKSGWNEDFGNQYVYRYYDLFQNPEMIESYFEQIPFLNGGLFECLDYKDKDEYIDGFTERKRYQPNIPNYLFFGDERKVDLNRDFGTKNKTYKVRGLIDILSSFNFTIDENTPDDQDVALDPELLGRVFENLLASFNPETSTTARKATGSYYTPREIVDYMVTESLKTYFQTHLEGIENIDEKLEDLFSNATGENPFSSEESKKLVELIESMKIVDPAVGSGAFPMGALNKMVLILGKVDPGNQLWKQVQLDAADSIPDPSVRREAKEKIEEFFQGKNADYGRKLYLIQKCIYGVDIQQIAVEIAKLRFFISLMVDEKIDDQKENHGIEPLPNLDFKLMRGNSLIEYGSPDLIVKGKDEEKNKLIDSYFEMKEKYFFTSEHEVKKNLFDQINNIIIHLANYDTQKQFEEENKRLQGFKAQSKLFGTLPGENLTFEDNRSEVRKQSKRLKSVEEKIIKPGTDHFEWHLYFNEVFERGGFDIVIANPPYVRIQSIDQHSKDIYNKLFVTAKGKYDLYILFTELAINLLRSKGYMSYIMPNKFTNTSYGSSLRELLLNKTAIFSYIDFSDKGVFEAVTNYPCIINLKKCILENNYIEYSNVKRISSTLPKSLSAIKNATSFNNEDVESYKIKQNGLSSDSWVFSNNSVTKLIEKFKTSGIYDCLIEYTDSIYEGLITGNNKVYFVDNATIKLFELEKELLKKLPKGKKIQKYYIGWDNYYVIYPYTLRNGKTVVVDLKNYPNTEKYLNKNKETLLKRNYLTASGKRWYEIWNPRRIDVFATTKIITPNLSSNNRFALDEESNNSNYYCLDHDCYGIILKDKSPDNYYLILAILNSNITNFFIRNTSPMFSGGYYKFHTQYLNKIPIPKNLKIKTCEGIVQLVKEINKITQNNYKNNNQEQTKISDYQKQIDQLVYKLYGLTPEEIEIVEKATK